MTGAVIRPNGFRVAAGMYRREWWRLAAVFLLSGAVGLLAVGLVAIGLGTLGPSLGISPRNPLMQVITIGLLQVGIAFPWLAGMAAMVGISQEVLDGQRQHAIRTYSRGLTRAPLLAVGLVLYAGAVIAAMLVSNIVFQLRLVLLPVAVVALATWWLRPAWRRRWLKWVIVVCAPFGLLLYTAVSLALWLPAMVLEDAGPVRGLTRSARLALGNWFELGIAGAVALLVLALANVPFSLAVFAVTSRFGGDAAGPQSVAVGTGLTVIFFGGFPILVLTLMFSRLRAKEQLLGQKSEIGAGLPSR